MANPVVAMKTSLGELEIELFEAEAPVTVANFLSYVDSGFFNGTIFHRVIPGFMIQGGGFTTDFVQKETRQPIRNESDNQISNRRGTVAMARTSVPDSATCQFFINLVDNDFLDFKSPSPALCGYCVFGRVVKGMETVDAIARVKTGSRPPHADVPVENVEIISAERV